jgi:Putative bacterial sensory transduction regulator
MRLLPAIALACALFLPAGSVTYAQTRPQPQGQQQQQQGGQVLTKLNAKQVAGILQQIGYRSEVVNDKNGDYIKATINNTNVAVGFYNCDNQGCRSFQYWTYWAKDPGLNETYANAWNKNYLFAKAYVDSEGDFDFVMDVNADGGITVNTIAESARWFDALLGELFKFQPK